MQYSHASRKHQRSDTVGIGHAGIGVMRQQEFDTVGRVLSRGVVQRALVPAVHVVDGAWGKLEKKCRCLGVAVAASPHERRDPVLVGNACQGLVLQQHADNRGVSAHGGLGQRRESSLVAIVDAQVHAAGDVGPRAGKR